MSSRKKTTRLSDSLAAGIRRAVPCALSLVLVAQCVSLSLPTAVTRAYASEAKASTSTATSAAAVETAPQGVVQPDVAAAPSWNDVTSDSAQIIEGKPSSGNGKAIAEAAKITPVEGATTAAANILTPAQVKDKEKAVEVSAPVVSTESKETSTVVSEKSDKVDKAVSETNEVLVVDDAPAKSSEVVKTVETAPTQDAVKIMDSVKPAEAASTTATETTSAGATTADTALTSPAATSLIVPVPTETSEKAAEKAPPRVGVHGTVDSLSSEMLQSLGATVNVTETTTQADGTVQEGGVLIVDCDEKEQVQDEIKYENLDTDEGKTHIKAGARFPVVVSSQISSKTAHKGDAVEARLKYDLKIGDRLIAHKGAEVHGHINYALKARSVMHSLVSSERWYRNSGCLGVEFDEIINDKGEHLPLVACPARTSRIVKNKNEGRVLGVNHLGQVTGPWSQQLRYKAVRIGLNAAMAPAGVFSFGAMPVALGLIGAANPSFAFMKPVGNNVRHRRLKGFAWGFLSGVPGSWIIEDTVTKGQESIIKPGDEFLAEFRQEFNGEPASEAQLMPNASVKVHGDVRSGKGKDKK